MSENYLKYGAKQKHFIALAEYVFGPTESRLHNERKKDPFYFLHSV